MLEWEVKFLLLIPDPINALSRVPPLESKVRRSFHSWSKPLPPSAAIRLFGLLYWAVSFKEQIRCPIHSSPPVPSVTPETQ